MALPNHDLKNCFSDEPFAFQTFSVASSQDRSTEWAQPNCITDDWNPTMKTRFWNLQVLELTTAIRGSWLLKIRLVTAASGRENALDKTLTPYTNSHRHVCTHRDTLMVGEWAKWPPGPDGAPSPPMTMLYKWIELRSRSPARLRHRVMTVQRMEKKEGSRENGGRESVQISATRAWKDGHVAL